MIVTVASFKGGQAKTTTAVHLAAFFQKDKPTLLIDGDPSRSATGLAKRKGLPFRVIDERQAARFARQYEHIIIDTRHGQLRRICTRLLRGVTCSSFPLRQML